MSLRKSDFVDVDFVDAEELSSDGYLSYLSTAIVSTTSGTKLVTVNLPSDGEGLITGLDHPVEAGDRVRLVGTSGADGYYTINSVLTDTTFNVLESIATSTGGTIYFIYPSGASKIGFDPIGLTVTNSKNIQDAIRDVANAPLTIAGASYGSILYYDGSAWVNLSPATDGYFLQTHGGGNPPTWTNHESVRKLVHLADGGGPFEGFASGTYRETLPSNNPFPTSITWWNSPLKVQKIVEKIITYNSNKTINTIIWKSYDTDGTTVLATVTDTISYSGVFEFSRVRTIT